MNLDDRPSELANSSPPVTSLTRVSLIVPVFNSETSLRLLHAEIASCAASPKYDFEIVYVDDGSTDGSRAVLHDIAKHSANVVVVEHPCNRGQAKALLTGIFAARSQVVVTLDDDLQHHPADIPRLLAALATASPTTLVMGVSDSIKRPLWRGWLGICANAISNLFLDKRLPLQLTTFCAFRKQLCADFDPNSDHDIPLITALVQAADITRTIPVHLDPSLRGRSRYGFGSLVRLFLSRARFYKLSKLLAWGVGALLLMAASAALLPAEGRAGHIFAIVLLLAGAAIYVALALLAVKVERQADKFDRLRSNRAA